MIKICVRVCLARSGTDNGDSVGFRVSVVADIISEAVPPHLCCPSKQVYLYVFVNISKANDWIQVDRLPRKRNSWAGRVTSQHN